MRIGDGQIIDFSLFTYTRKKKDRILIVRKHRYLDICVTLSMFVDRFRFIENVSYDAVIAYRVDVAHDMETSPIVFEF